MSHFPYAIAFNLTFLKEADADLLKKIGMNPKRVHTMVGETYFFRQQKLKKDTAEYWYSYRVNKDGRTRDHRNTMVSNPSVQDLTDNQTILLAAHELKHCERRTRQGKVKHINLLGGVLGALAGFALIRDYTASVIIFSSIHRNRCSACTLWRVRTSPIKRLALCRYNVLSAYRLIVCAITLRPK